jgi:type I restriction enzyme S subunit
MSETKPGYKQTEVGVIPEEWNCTTLGEMLALRRGHDLTERQRRPGSVPVFGSSGQNGFHDTALVSGPGVVLGRSGASYGQAHLCVEAYWPHNTCLYVTDFKSNDTKFTFYFLKGYDFSSHNSGGAQQSLNRNFIGPLPIPLPPLPEQQAIAGALGDADALIEALEALITKKRNLKQGAMQDLLTGTRRLPGFRGEWGELNLAKHSHLKARIGWQGLTTEEYLSTGEFYLVTGTDFVGGRVHWETCCFVERERYVQDPNIQLRVGDVLLTKDGTIGKVGYVERLPGPATLNSGVFVIRPKDASYDPQFAYYVLNSVIFDEFLNRLQAGSTIVHLYQKDVVHFKFLAPSLDEQRAIAAVLSDMDAEIAALEDKLAKARDVKQGMMQVLLTGEIRLV